MDINMCMMNHLCHHHDDHHANKLNLTTPTSWDENLAMAMEHHHHHHHHQDHDHRAQDQEQQVHHHHQNLHHLIPLLDPVWPNYNILPTPHPSPPSIQLPTSSSSPLIIKSVGESQYHHHDHHQEVLVEEEEVEEEEEEELGAMKEMMYRIAVMQPVDIDPATIRKPKRRNVRISDDPQSVAARHRRERISEKIRILQRLVPGGTKLDTASMLDEAARYVKFLKRQIRQLQRSPTAPPPHLNPLLVSNWPDLDPNTSPSPGPSVTPIMGPASDDSKVVLIRDHDHHV